MFAVLSQNLTTKLYFIFYILWFMYRKVHHVIYFSFINKKSKTQGSSSWRHGSTVTCKANVRCGSSASIVFFPLKHEKELLCHLWSQGNLCEYTVWSLRGLLNIPLAFIHLIFMAHKTVSEFLMVQVSAGINHQEEWCVIS